MKSKLMLIFLTILVAILFFLQNAKTDKIVADNNSSYNAPFLLKGTCNIMQKPFSVLLQYVTPQHALTHFAGWLANSQKPWLKNCLIRYFLSRFDVDMKAAVIENPYDYPSFNSFFTRHLKPSARPISSAANDIVSPADGFVSQIGKIDTKTILQAKGRGFDLTSLLGGSEKRAQPFIDGNFATFYLSPKDYHRVHMPFNGKLKESIFIPGKLFSVNTITAATVPDLFARNERLVCIFDTDAGPMAIIFVGAMLVGSIETVWHAKTSSNEIVIESYNGSLQFDRGAELGHFKMGSTVIVLFGKDKIQWSEKLTENASVQMGQMIGHTLKYPEGQL